MSDRADYYAILGVTRDAEDLVIPAVYRALVKKYHPDVYPHEDGAKRIRDINAAYEVLGDPEKRAVYDAGHGGDQGYGAAADAPDQFTIVDIIDNKANIAVTNTIELHVPPAVFIDKYVLSLFGSPRRHSAAFKESWKRMPSLHAAGFEGFRLLESVLRRAVEEAASRCIELHIGARLEPLGEETLARLYEATDALFSSARYASITLDSGEQKRMLRTLGDELSEIILKAAEVLATAVLEQILSEGVPVGSVDSIEPRRQNAKLIMAQGVAGSLDQAIRALQLSVYDNTSALAVVFEQLLAAEGWEDRVWGFVDLVRAAGPEHFFEAGPERKLGTGDICLAEKIGQLFAERHFDVVLRGLECIRQGLLHDWDVRGEILLDHCFITVTNEILDVSKTLSWALPRLENMLRAEPVFFPGRLQGYLASQNEKADAWARAHAETVAAAGSLSDIGAAGRAAELLLPGRHTPLLAQAAWDGFVRRLNGGDIARPRDLIEEITRLWRIDAAAQWRDAAIFYLAWRFANGAIANAEEYEALTALTAGGAPDPDLAQAVHCRTAQFLAAGERESPSAILAHAMTVLGTTDRWISGRPPTQSLQALRALMLQDVGNLPGELMPVTAPTVAQVTRQLRTNGRYFSLGGTVALVAGRTAESCYALTPNGIYRAAGVFHPYAGITKVEPVQGWTQVYLKYQVDSGSFELNNLGSMAVATFLSTVIGNGLRLARELAGEEVLGLFAGRDIASELYLDRWVGPGQLVLVTDEHRMLPAALAREKVLAGLTAQPSGPGLAVLPFEEEGRTGMAIASEPETCSPDMDQSAVVRRTDPAMLILDLCSQFAGKGFGIGAGIDARKLLCARKAFPMPLDLKVFGLLDATLLGTNEKGLAITSNGIYWKNGWVQETQTNHLSWKEFNEIEIEQRFDKFALGAGNFFDTSGSTYPNGQLNNLLNTLQANLRLLDLISDGPTLETQTAAVPENAPIERIIEWACNNHSGGAIPLGDLINPKKLANARKEFPIPTGVQVVGLIDCTVFGSNKTGFAICTDGIYWKNDWTTKTLKTSLSWSDLVRREIGGASREVLFGVDAVLGISAATVTPTTLVAVLNSICDAVRKAKPGA